MANGNDLLTLLEAYTDNYKSIPTERNYWLIRTEGGEYYDSFKRFNYVAIGHNMISVADVNRLQIQHKDDIKELKSRFKKLAKEKYPKEERPGLIGNQTVRFSYELKKGDVVVIPSSNSDNISIGYVQSDNLLNTTKEDIVITDCPFLKRKRVHWVNEISKHELDIYFYKALHAHQAINSIGNYADVIERTLGNFYFMDKEGNLVLDVNEDDDIKALDLFTLGYSILEYSKGFYEYHNIDPHLYEIDIKINLNSKGKIQLKSNQKATLFGLALLIVGAAGGGLEVDVPGINISLKTDGVIQKVIDYQNTPYAKDLKEKINANMDSLKVVPPTDSLKLIQYNHTIPSSDSTETN